MKPFITIRGRKIGYDFDPLVIAELGINHNGSLESAIQIADSAIDSGAEIVKHQTHIIEDEMSEAAKKVIPGNSDLSIWEIMKNCSLDENDEKELQKHIESRGAIFISTPFSRAAFFRLESFSVPAYKIGSGECNNFPLVRLIAKSGKPTIISTGMNDFRSIDKVSEIFESEGTEYAFMHTTNLYPTPPELVRLGAITEMINRYEVPIGLSDHTSNNLACMGAVALGASILERHFTDNLDREGPDISSSMGPEDLKNLINDVKTLKKLRGGKKSILKEEQVTIDFAYATVVSIKNLSKGELLTENNIWVKRPGTGQIKAEFYESLIGKKINKDISEGHHLRWDDLED